MSLKLPLKASLKKMYLNNDIISNKANKTQGKMTEEPIYEWRLATVCPGAMGVKLDWTSQPHPFLLVWGQSSFSAWGIQALNITLIAKSKTRDRSVGFLSPQADVLNWCLPIADDEH